MAAVAWPAHFARRIEDVHGARGRAWLAALPARLEAWCAARELRLGAPFGLSYAWVAPAVGAGGEACVVKAAPPHAGLAREAAALALFAGRGAARLLEADLASGILRLERLRPGRPLAALDDDARATACAAAAMRRLARPVPSTHPFPHVRDQAAGLARLRRRFGGGTGPFPPALVERAERLFAALLAAPRGEAVLHGDLHHANLLSDGDAWRAIDPKGVVGEPTCEASALLRNPQPGVLAGPEPGRTLARRVALLAEALEVDRERVAGWGLAQAVLSAWWSFEDHGAPGATALGCAALLAPHAPAP